MMRPTTNSSNVIGRECHRIICSRNATKVTGYNLNTPIVGVRTIEGIPATSYGTIRLAIGVIAPIDCIRIGTSTTTTRTIPPSSNTQRSHIHNPRRPRRLVGVEDMYPVFMLAKRLTGQLLQDTFWRLIRCTNHQKLLRTAPYIFYLGHPRTCLFLKTNLMPLGARIGLRKQVAGHRTGKCLMRCMIGTGLQIGLCLVRSTPRGWQ